MANTFEVLACSGHWLELNEDLRELPTVTLDAELDEPLREVSARGQALLGFDWKWVYYNFVTEPHEGRRFRAPYLGAYVADDGALTWAPPQLDGVKISDVVRTKQEGLFAGDPFALLIQEPRGGDGAIAGWEDLYRILAHAGTLYTGLKATRAAARVLKKVLETYQRQWELRNATPRGLMEVVLGRDGWDYVQLARLLSVSLSTIVEFLTALGYVQDPNTRLFRLSSDAPGARLRREVEERLLNGDPREARSRFWSAQEFHPG